MIKIIQILLGLGFLFFPIANSNEINSYVIDDVIDDLVNNSSATSSLVSNYTLDRDFAINYWITRIDLISNADPIYNWYRYENFGNGAPAVYAVGSPDYIALKAILKVGISTYNREFISNTTAVRNLLSDLADLGKGSDSLFTIIASLSAGTLNTISIQGSPQPSNIQALAGAIMVGITEKTDLIYNIADTGLYSYTTSPQLYSYAAAYGMANKADITDSTDIANITNACVTFNIFDATPTTGQIAALINAYKFYTTTNTKGIISLLGADAANQFSLAFAATQYWNNFLDSYSSNQDFQKFSDARMFALASTVANDPSLSGGILGYIFATGAGINAPGDIAIACENVNDDPEFILELIDAYKGFTPSEQSEFSASQQKSKYAYAWVAIKKYNATNSSEPINEGVIQTLAENSTTNIDTYIQGYSTAKRTEGVSEGLASAIANACSTFNITDSEMIGSLISACKTYNSGQNTNLLSYAHGYSAALQAELGIDNNGNIPSLTDSGCVAVRSVLELFSPVKLSDVPAFFLALLSASESSSINKDFISILFGLVNDFGTNHGLQPEQLFAGASWCVQNSFIWGTVSLGEKIALWSNGTSSAPTILELMLQRTVTSLYLPLLTNFAFFSNPGNSSLIRVGDNSVYPFITPMLSSHTLARIVKSPTKNLIVGFLGAYFSRPSSSGTSTTESSSTILGTLSAFAPLLKPFMGVLNELLSGSIALKVQHVEFAIGLYQTLYKKAPTLKELNQAMAILTSGAQDPNSISDVQQKLINSLLATNLGIADGLLELSSDTLTVKSGVSGESVKTFISNLYKNALQREGEEAGINNWNASLGNVIAAGQFLDPVTNEITARQITQDFRELSAEKVVEAVQSFLVCEEFQECVSESVVNWWLLNLGLLYNCKKFLPNSYASVAKISDIVVGNTLKTKSVEEQSAWSVLSSYFNLTKDQLESLVAKYYASTAT